MASGDPARCGRRDALEDSIVITSADEALLQRAIAIAAHAVTLGDAPYGSLLTSADSTILIEARTTRCGATTTSARTRN